MAEYACSGVMTLKITISIAPRMEPPVLPMGKKGTAGKTAKIQKIAKATEPKTTFLNEPRTISVTCKIKLVCELPLSRPPPLQLQ
jgi:midasin (ATPase involved in ribosome maturation)